MLTTSEKFKEKINSTERFITASIYINGKVYATNKIRDFSYTSSIGDGALAIGSVNACSVDININELVEGLKENDEVKCSLGVQGEMLIPMGTFYLTEIKLDRNSNVTTLKAMDKMMYLGGEYHSTLNYPALIRDVVNEICNTIGVERVANRISDKKTIEFVPKKCTYREMLSYIGQIENSFVIFDRDGKLDFRKLQRTDTRIKKDHYFMKGLEVNDIEYRVDGISVDLKKEGEDKKILAAGSATGNQLRLTNPLMTQNYLDSLHAEIKSNIFKPYSLSWRGNPAVEVGDWVQIESYDGHYIGVPVLNMTLDFNGGLKGKISADVKPVGSTSYEYKGTIQKQIEFLDARVGADGTTIYADTAEPKDPKKGDSWFKPNGAYTDLYIFEGGKWVLKVSTGNVEELVTKITNDEVLTPKIVAAIAKIIELDANKITTGELRSVIIRDDTGLNSWNLKTGELNLNGNVNINVSKQIKDYLAKNDKGIKNVTVEYAYSGSKTECPSVGWTEVYTNDPEKYLWRRLKFIYNDGRIEYKDCRCLIAEREKWEIIGDYWYHNGEKTEHRAIGKDGKNGRGVKSIIPLYYLSDSDGQLLGGDWIETQPKWQKGKYIWTKQRIIYDDEAEEETKATLAENLNKVLENTESVIQELENVTSSFVQTAESVVMGIVRNYSKTTDLEQLKSEIQNLMTADKNGFNFQFKTLEERLSSIGKTVELQNKWIRLVDGEIHMGRDDSPIDTVYTNESLEFRYNEVAVAKFTNDFLEVRNVAVKNQLKFGDMWAIRPGEYIAGKGYNLNDVWLGGEI